MKVLWALEPFHQDAEKLRGMHRCLKQLAGSASSIEAAFVVTRTEADLALAFDVPEKDRFTAYPLKIAKQTLKQASVKIEDSKVSVVDYPTFSTTKAVDRLLKLAQEKQSEVIALFSHAKKGYLKFVLGSFAETAIHRSKTNLLILSPVSKSADKIKSVFFASDFSAESKKHFLYTLKLCAQLKARLVVFHQPSFAYQPKAVSVDKTSAAYIQKTNQIRDEMIADAAKLKVKCEVILDARLQKTSDLILAAAKKQEAHLLVLAAKSGSLAALMGGSVLRQVLRQSQIPVLVLK